jgi:hypothetical protein
MDEEEEEEEVEHCKVKGGPVAHAGCDNHLHNAWRARL